MRTMVTTKSSRRKIGFRWIVGLARRVDISTCGSHSGALAGSSVSRSSSIGGAIGLATLVAISISHGGHGASGLIARPTIGSSRVQIGSLLVANSAIAGFARSHALGDFGMGS